MSEGFTGTIVCSLSASQYHWHCKARLLSCDFFILTIVYSIVSNHIFFGFKLQNRGAPHMDF